MNVDSDNVDPLPRIPVPMSAYWREFRQRVLPVVLFAVVVAAVFVLWKHTGVNSGIPGIGEGVRSLVSSPRIGTVQQLRVQPYQWVKAGEPIAIILPVDPGAKVDLLRSELDLARLRFAPSFAEENAVSFERLRLELLQTKAELSMARVNLQRAEIDLGHQGELYLEKLVPAAIYEMAQMTRDLYKTEVAGKSNAVIEIERAMQELGSFGTARLPATNQLLVAQFLRLESLHAAVTNDWSPMTLVAPIDGMVSGIYRREGENIVEGEPLMVINSPWSERIVGYLRQPYQVEPAVGMKVRITTRERKRQQYWSEVTGVGAHVEVITNALAFVRQGAMVDSGLPITVVLPPTLKLRPGEVVDLSFQSGVTKGRAGGDDSAESKPSPN